MYDKRKPDIFEANLLYLVLGLLLLFIGYLVQSRDIYSGLLITEFILVLLPNLLYLKLRGYSLRYVLKLNKISLKQTLYTVGVMIFSYPVAIFINSVFLSIINSFSSALPTTVPIPTSNKEYLIGMFIIAISPGICEEIMFRGTISKAYDRLGYKKSIIISAILFGVFHFNIMNLFGPIFLGIILGILVHKTNSIYTSMLGHTLNNGIALTIGFLLTKFAPKLEEAAVEEMIMPENMQFLASLIILGTLALISFVILTVLLKKFPTTDISYYDYDFSISELSFHEDRFKYIKYLPILIIFIIFIVLNVKLLFGV